MRRPCRHNVSREPVHSRGVRQSDTPQDRFLYCIVVFLATFCRSAAYRGVQICSLSAARTAEQGATRHVNPAVASRTDSLPCGGRHPVPSGAPWQNRSAMRRQPPGGIQRLCTYSIMLTVANPALQGLPAGFLFGCPGTVAVRPPSSRCDFAVRGQNLRAVPWHEHAMTFINDRFDVNHRGGRGNCPEHGCK